MTKMKKIVFDGTKALHGTFFFCNESIFPANKKKIAFTYQNFQEEQKKKFIPSQCRLLLFSRPLLLNPPLSSDKNKKKRFQLMRVGSSRRLYYTLQHRREGKGGGGRAFTFLNKASNKLAWSRLSGPIWRFG